MPERSSASCEISAGYKHPSSSRRPAKSPPSNRSFGHRFVTSQERGTLHRFQNATEFWNVATRPIEANGFGWEVEKARKQLVKITRQFTLLYDTRDVFKRWQRLVSEHAVRGVKVHDERLAASTLAHLIDRLLTFNTADFERYSEIVATHPETVVADEQERRTISDIGS